APHVGVPFDAMPRTQRHDRSIDVRISPPIVARVLRQHMQPAIGTQYYELLSAGRAAAIKKEGNFVAIGTKIERRRWFPPEANVHLLTKICAATSHTTEKPFEPREGRREIDGRRRRALNHVPGIDKLIDVWR